MSLQDKNDNVKKIEKKGAWFITDGIIKEYTTNEPIMFDKLSIKTKYDELTFDKELSPMVEDYLRLRSREIETNIKDKFKAIKTWADLSSLDEEYARSHQKLEYLKANKLELLKKELDYYKSPSDLRSLLESKMVLIKYYLEKAFSVDVPSDDLIQMENGYEGFPLKNTLLAEDYIKIEDILNKSANPIFAQSRGNIFYIFVDVTENDLFFDSWYSQNIYLKSIGVKFEAKSSKFIYDSFEIKIIMRDEDQFDSLNRKFNGKIIDF